MQLLILSTKKSCGNRYVIIWLNDSASQVNILRLNAVVTDKHAITELPYAAD